MKRPNIRFGLWSQISLALIGTMVVGFAGWFLRVLPLLSVEPSVAGRLAAEFANDQLVAVADTGFIAVIIGRYAVKQVELGSQAIAEERTARAEAEAAEMRRILMALLDELHHNWVTALYKEGRVRLPTDLSRRVTFEFRRQTFDSVKAGPLWGIPQGFELWPSISRAYERSDMLTARLRPEPSWQARLIGAGVAALLRSGTVRDRFLIVLGPLLGSFIVDQIRVWELKRQGEIAETRRAIESAADAIHLKLFNRPLSWDIWYAETPPGCDLVRPAQADVDGSQRP